MSTELNRTALSTVRPMTPTAIEAARAELNAIIRDSWAIHAQSGDPRDAELARQMESEARALLALLLTPLRKGKRSNKAKKRKAFKHFAKLDAGAPILSQVRSLGR